MDRHIHNHFSGRYDPGGEDFGGENLTEVMQMAVTHFKSLHGLALEFYGANTGENTFKIDEIVFKVLEDPADGYRSYLGAVDYSDSHDSIFFSSPIARVYIESYKLTKPNEYDNDDDDLREQGYCLKDINDSHVWLEFGTDYSDDYYPYFIFRYYPKLRDERS